jgi:hypothetical protein
MVGRKRSRWLVPIGLAAALAALFVAARWDRIRNWYRPPTAGLPDTSEIVELRAQVWASGSRGQWETGVPEIVVPPSLVPRIWRRIDGAEYVADPPVSKAEPLGELVATTRRGEVVRVTFYEAGSDLLVFTRDGESFFRSEPRNEAGFPLGGGLSLAGTLRHAWVESERRD